MADGVLGRFDLTAATDTLVYTCPAGKIAFISVNLVSRAGSQTVRIALPFNTTPGNTDYVEYEFPIAFGGIPLMREGIILQATDRVYVRASAVSVTCVVYGREQAA